MQRKEFKDRAGRRLILWDKLPGTLSISAPGEGGFIFIADLATAGELSDALAEWVAEHETS